MNPEWLLCHLPSIVGLFFSIMFYVLPNIITRRIFAGMRDVGFKDTPSFLRIAFHNLTRPLSCSILCFLFLAALFSGNQIMESIFLSIGFTLLILSAIFWTAFMGFLMHLANMANAYGYSSSPNRSWQEEENRWEDEEDSY